MLFTLRLGFFKKGEDLMAKKNEHAMVAMPTGMQVDDGAVCINHMNVKNLKKHLNQFPEDAEVTIHHDYKYYDCQIAINFEHQKETNEVMLLVGFQKRAD